MAGLSVIVAGTPDSLTDPERGLFSVPALRSRLRTCSVSRCGTGMPMDTAYATVSNFCRRLRDANPHFDAVSGKLQAAAAAHSSNVNTKSNNL